MDVFKISVDTQQVHKITQENFDQVTKKQAPGISQLMVTRDGLRFARLVITRSRL